MSTAETIFLTSAKWSTIEHFEKFEQLENIMTAIELITMLAELVEKHGVEIMVESRTCAGDIRAANKPFIYGHTAAVKTIVIDSH